MPVSVRGYLTYKAIVGKQSVTIKKGEKLTVAGLLNKLANELGQEFSDSIFDPQTKTLGEHVAVIINGKNSSYAIVNSAIRNSR